MWWYTYRPPGIYADGLYRNYVPIRPQSLHRKVLPIAKCDTTWNAPVRKVSQAGGTCLHLSTEGTDINLCHSIVLSAQYGR
jgi:hypothetical protein